MCSSSFSLVACVVNSVTNCVTILRKIPSEMEVAPRYKLLTLLTLFTLLTLLTWHTLSTWFTLLTWFALLIWS